MERIKELLSTIQRIVKHDSKTHRSKVGEVRMKKKMWFISENQPTDKLVKKAEKMGYELVYVEATEIKKDSDVGKLWLQLLQAHPIQKGDALVITGKLRWASWIIRMHERALNFFLGYKERPGFRNSLGMKIWFDEIYLYTVDHDEFVLI